MKSQHKGLVQLRDLTVLHISLDSHEETVENVIEIAKERQARKVEGVKLLSLSLFAARGTGSKSVLTVTDWRCTSGMWSTE